MLLHEAARHSIHSIETLNVALETVSTLQEYVKESSNKSVAGGEASIEANSDAMSQLDFHKRMLRNLLLRAQSNKERLQNEIALVRSR